MAFRSRILGVIGLAALGWIVAESVLVYAATKTFGVLPVFAFLTFKGLGGLLILAISFKAILTTLTLRNARRGLSGAAAALFSAAGAALILLPGLMTTFAGIALFSPSVRDWLTTSVKRRGRTRDQILSLDPSEWSEVRPESNRRKPKRRPIAP
jgi:UPF0716 family protein affecting phage T7 exclusion